MTKENQQSQPTLSPDLEGRIAHHRPGIIAFSSLLIIIIMVGATHLLTRQSNVTETPTTTAPQQPEITAGDVLESLRKRLAIDLIEFDGYIEPYAVEGYPFATGLGSSTKSVNTTVEKPNSNQTISSIRQFLVSLNFKEALSSAQLGEDTISSNLFKHPNILCQVTSTVDNSEDTNDVTVSTSCVEMTTLKRYAEAQKPLYDAYKAKTTTSTIALIGYPDPVHGPILGYRTTTLGISGSGSTSLSAQTAYFYTIPSSDEWIYFTSSQQHVPCSAFETDDLLLAYSGQDCYNDKTKKEDIVSHKTAET